MAIAPTAFPSLRAVSTALVLLASLAYGQTAPPAPPQSIEDALHQMSDQAGVIFAGPVVAIRRYDQDNAASGFVEIEFRVDQAVRGCTAGVPYLLHEWAGLWTGGVPRYRIGQRLLMFLHPPGPTGLSSPIGGMDGAIPIHGSQSSLIATSSTVPQYSVADLRWIGAELLRPISYEAASVQASHRSALPTPFVAPPIVVAVAEGVSRADIPATSASTGSSDKSAASIPAQQASVDAVIGMITSWQKAQHSVH